jgi:hypothetical protein
LQNIIKGPADACIVNVKTNGVGQNRNLLGTVTVAIKAGFSDQEFRCPAKFRV